jgi:hypothetical protein
VEFAQVDQTRRQIQTDEPIEIEVELGQPAQIGGRGEIRELVEKQIERE